MSVLLASIPLTGNTLVELAIPIYRARRTLDALRDQLRRLASCCGDDPEAYVEADAVWAECALAMDEAEAWLVSVSMEYPGAPSPSQA